MRIFILKKKEANFQLPTQKVTASEFIFMLIVCFAHTLIVQFRVSDATVVNYWHDFTVLYGYGCATVTVDVNKQNKYNKLES